MRPVFIQHKTGYISNVVDDEHWLPKVPHRVTGLDRISPDGPSLVPFKDDVLHDLKGRRYDMISKQFGTPSFTTMCGQQGKRVLEEWKAWRDSLPDTVDGAITNLRDKGMDVPSYYIPVFSGGGGGGGRWGGGGGVVGTWSGGERGGAMAGGGGLGVPGRCGGRWGDPGVLVRGFGDVERQCGIR